jgi:hypothetical protein
MEELLNNASKLTSDANLTAFNFPLDFVFKIGTFSNDFIAKDASGKIITYVRQKIFKLKEDVVLFEDETKRKEIYRIKADRWIDFNANYSFSDGNDTYMGSVGRKGMKSLWKASYSIFNPDKELEYTVREENPWVKVGDALIGQVPILNFFTGYLFHPKYIALDLEGNIIARLSKESSFLGRKFKLELVGQIPNEDGERIMLSFMMIALLERSRG